MKQVTRALALFGLLGAVGLQGCATTQLHPSVPANLANATQIADIDDVRFWGDGGGGPFARILKAEAGTLKAKYEARAQAHPHNPGRPLESNILALSGGADDGAFGAGVLVGWGQRGARPQFDVVTGVSTGSLIAPFAFLGRDYDRQLAEIFVKYGGEDIYTADVVSGLLGGAAVADNAPLARLIEGYVDSRMLARIATERARGRVLLIGTTNLLAQRPVVWDMGKIAQAGTPQALALFRQVLLASAAVPAVFPPVHVEVVAAGKTYQEMHVDGGLTRDVFLAPDAFEFSLVDQAVGRKINRRLWIINNGKITPEYADVKETTMAVASRSLETLTKNHGLGDLLRIYDKTRAEGIDFNLTHIPADFSAPRPKPFDRAYMQALYARGHQLGSRGVPWVKAPPGGLHASR